MFDGYYHAFDLDGTLINYNYSPGDITKVNWDLIKGLKQVPAAICTNQGGLTFGMQYRKRADGRLYPAPEHFIDRLITAIDAMDQHGVTVGAVRVSLWHPRAIGYPLTKAANKIRQAVGSIWPYMDLMVFTSSRARKPEPMMLESVKCEVYFGDSQEDEAAALAAGVGFVRVERFL